MESTEKNREELQLEKERIRKENLQKALGDDMELSAIKAFCSEDYPAVDEIDEWFDKHFFANNADEYDD